jgi:hypothetical protein
MMPNIFRSCLAGVAIGGVFGFVTDILYNAKGMLVAQILDSLDLADMDYQPTRVWIATSMLLFGLLGLTAGVIRRQLSKR